MGNKASCIINQYFVVDAEKSLRLVVHPSQV